MFKKILFISLFIMIALVGVFALPNSPIKNVFAWANNDNVNQNCTYCCPVIHFEWDTLVKVGHEWIKSHHSADIAYDKSNDQNKCHRPSDSYLKSHYGLSTDAIGDFKKANSEWKEKIVFECITPTTTPFPTE